MPEVLVIGDDLTGTNATAAIYARSGLKSVTLLEGSSVDDLPQGVVVLAASTDSRHLGTSEAASVVRKAVDSYGPKCRLLVKRVDTTLRGNIGAEIEACLVEWRLLHDKERVKGLVVPAFPAAGRVTVGGYQLLDGVPVWMGPAGIDPLTPLTHSRVASIIHDQSDLHTAEIGLDTVMSGKEAIIDAMCSVLDDADLIVLDSATPSQQTLIADAAVSVGQSQSVTWVIVDTGPFGAAYTAAMGIENKTEATRPVLAIIGSPTAQSRAQADYLESSGTAKLIAFDATGTSADELISQIKGAVESGFECVGIRTMGTPETCSGADSKEDAERILKLIGEFSKKACQEISLSGIYASGGDVGITVLSSLGACGYAIETEVLPLAVCGSIVGGQFDGLGFATKGGLIGDETAALRCVEALKSRRGLPIAL
jgi:uncharacterized protein YgbK (DUF1537 family)